MDMSVRKRVLLLTTTTGYQTRAFVEAAQRMGLEVGFGSDRCRTLEDPWQDRKSTRLNSSHIQKSRMPSSA